MYKNIQTPKYQIYIQPFFVYIEFQYSKKTKFCFKECILSLEMGTKKLANFYDVLRLSYRPSNFARANKPYAAG